MISQKDKNILQEINKKYLLKFSFNNPLIKSSLTFKEHINFCNFINELTFEETIGLIFSEDIRSFEVKFRKYLKYGFAAIAGLTMTGPGIGIVAGPPLAMFILFKYRKLTDTCNQQCFSRWPLSSQKKICKYECQVRAATVIASQIRSEMARCVSVAKPESCKKKLEKQYIKWSKRVQQTKIKLTKAKLGVEAVKRKKLDTATKRRMNTLKANFQISTPQLINLIFENKFLRNALSFQQHLKLYYQVKNLKEVNKSIVKIHKINPKKERVVRAIAVGSTFALPVPLLSLAINKILKSYNIKCIVKCLGQRKHSQKLCRNQCTYLSAQTAIKFLKKEFSNCNINMSAKVIKCKRKINKMIDDWEQREYTAKLKYKLQLDLEEKNK